MKTVYIIAEADYQERVSLWAFSSEERAEAFIASKGLSQFTNIREVELDEEQQ